VPAFDARPARKHIVNLKVSTGELQALRQAVQRSGAPSVSAYLRRLIAVAVASQ
jgi:hypothetical protein